MTSDQESSNRGFAAAPYSEIESLAGAFHPHAIEVQDFSYYSLVIDVRSRAEYEDDHIPGALQIEPPPSLVELPDMRAENRVKNAVGSAWGDSAAHGIPAALAEIVRPVKLDQAILIYCGRGGLVSRPLAEALRWRGWTVDVLPGGWINYRRWVQAGLEVLPRLVAFRLIACSLGSEAARALRALREVGHQVLDVEELAGWRHGALGAPLVPQPAQAWFESQLMQAIRGFDPRSPVWVGDLGSHAGALSLPGALTDALAIAPTAALKAEVPERVRRWQEDEPLLHAEISVVLQSVAALSPAPSSKLLAHWRQLTAGGVTDLLLSSVLTDYIDPAYAEGAAERSADRHSLHPLVVDSLTPNALLAAVRAWLRPPELGALTG
ncbi:MAG: rhodanese-like domain-containing protein [Pseudomonadota bacterium]|nr:rhodanese-like domain-containing protein [Pseudomonadota bacterium]